MEYNTGSLMFQRAMVLISFLRKKRSKQSHTIAKPMPSVWKSYFKHKQNQTLHMPSLPNICKNISEYLLLESQCGQVKEAKQPHRKSPAHPPWSSSTLCPPSSYMSGVLFGDAVYTPSASIYQLIK